MCDPVPQREHGDHAHGIRTHGCGAGVRPPDQGAPPGGARAAAAARDRRPAAGVRPRREAERLCPAARGRDPRDPPGRDRAARSSRPAPRTFDDAFRPAALARARWQRVWLAEHRGAALPPISVVAGRRRLRRPRRPPPRLGRPRARRDCDRRDDRRRGGLSGCARGAPPAGPAGRPDDERDHDQEPRAPGVACPRRASGRRPSSQASAVKRCRLRQRAVPIRRRA